MLIFVKFGTYLFVLLFFLKSFFNILILNRYKANERNFYTLGTLSEYVVCRELLWMFYAPSQMVVFQQNEETKEFSIRPNISIPSLTIVSI